MKKTSIILLLSFSVLACKKDKNEDSPLGQNNTVTYTINGQTYTVNESTQYTEGSPIRSTFVNCMVDKDARGWSYFHLKIEGAGLPFNMQIISPKGSANGLGKFPIKDLGDIVTEKFSGGQSYTISGGEINISELSLSKIVGIYQFSLKNPASTKTATGTFIINQPVQ